MSSVEISLDTLRNTISELSTMCDDLSRFRWDVGPRSRMTIEDVLFSVAVAIDELDQSITQLQSLNLPPSKDHAD